MRNWFFATLVVIFAFGGVLAQSPPTLRIVTETPNLPSELFYGDIKVKPLRLRPGTNTPITIDDADFFASLEDFLEIDPELPLLGLRTFPGGERPDRADDVVLAVFLPLLFLVLRLARRSRQYHDDD